MPISDTAVRDALVKAECRGAEVIKDLTLAYYAPEVFPGRSERVRRAVAEIRSVLEAAEAALAEDGADLPIAAE